MICPQTVNADQADADNDGRGDACAGDLDSDGVADGADTCPALPNPTQALSGCVGAFRSLTYGRDIRALAGTADGVVGATGGGLAQVTPMATTVVTNRNGLAENPLNGAFVDSHGRRWAVSNGALSVVRPDGFVYRMGPHD